MDAIAERALQYGLGGLIALVLLSGIVYLWKTLEGRNLSLQESWAARLEDSKAVQAVINAVNSAIQALTLSVDRRAGMTEALGQSQAANTAAVERQSELIERLCRKMDEADVVQRRVIEEIRDRLDHMDKSVTRLGEK